MSKRDIRLLYFCSNDHLHCDCVTLLFEESANREKFNQGANMTAKSAFSLYM
jgi:hypothetical protein